MKKIFAAFAALVILSCLALSMVSCGSVDMQELEKSLKGNSTYQTDVYEGETLDSKTQIKKIVVRTNEKKADDEEVLYIIEFVNEEIAELEYKLKKLDYDREEAELDFAEDTADAYEEIGAIDRAEDIREELEEEKMYDTVVKLKGAVLIYGSKAIYNEIF